MLAEILLTQYTFGTHSYSSSSAFMPIHSFQWLLSPYLYVYIIHISYLTLIVPQIYDYFLTLHLEIKFVWLSQWTYTKVLFLLIRYMAFTGAFLFMISELHLTKVTPDVVKQMGRPSILGRTSRTMQGDMACGNL